MSSGRDLPPYETRRAHSDWEPNPAYNHNHRPRAEGGRSGRGRNDPSQDNSREQSSREGSRATSRDRDRRERRERREQDASREESRVGSRAASRDRDRRDRTERREDRGHKDTDGQRPSTDGPRPSRDMERKPANAASRPFVEGQGGPLVDRQWAGQQHQQYEQQQQPEAIGLQPGFYSARKEDSVGATGYDYTMDQLQQSSRYPQQQQERHGYHHPDANPDENVAFWEQVAPQPPPGHLQPFNVRYRAFQPPPLSMSRSSSYSSLPEARLVNVSHVAPDAAYGHMPDQFPLRSAPQSAYATPATSAYTTPASTPSNSVPASPAQSRRPPRTQRQPSVYGGQQRNMHRVASTTPLINPSTETLIEPEPLQVLPMSSPKKYPPVQLMQPAGARKSFQVRALGRKALSFQRRQWFTNVCCIALCPFMMVIVSFLVGTIVSGLIKGQDRGFDIVYCSDRTSINEQNWPIFNLNAEAGIANTTAGTVPRTTRLTKHANFYSLLLLATAGGDIQELTELGLLSLFSDIPCVSWFGEGYPVEPSNNVYARPLRKQTNAYANKDSAYTAEVSSGWLDIFRSDILAKPLELKQAISLGSQFAQYQIRPWALVGVGPGVDPNEIGRPPIPRPLKNLNEIPATIPGSSNASMFKPGLSANGLLDTIEPRWYVDADVINTRIDNIQQVPFFTFNSQTPKELNTELTTALESVLTKLTTVDQSVLYKSSRTSADLATFVFRVNNVTKEMPYGTIYFEQIDHVRKQYKYTLSMGFDNRLATSGVFPTAGRRQALQISQLSNAILRRSNPELQDAVITQGTRLFPQVTTGGINLSISGTIGRVLYPFALSFLLPIFTLVLVREKEDRVLMMMKMNGLKSSVYYMSHYITFFLLYCISAAIFLASGAATKLDMFVKTEVTVLIILLVLWGAVQVAMALFFSSFFDRAQNALLIVFFVVLCGIIVSIAANQVFVTAPAAFFLWPPFAFYRCLAVINQASFATNARPYTLGNLRPGDEVWTAMIFMAAETAVLLLLAVYFSHILPSEYGIRKKWHYPVSQLFSSSSPRLGPGSDFAATSKHSQQHSYTAVENSREDDDVRAERTRVENSQYPPNCPLVINALHKAYPARHNTPAKQAVRSISLALAPSQVFGLLGPNGAGKTTLISILTGLYSPTSGSATIAGYDIRTHIHEIYKLIGVCPQFDLLWGELSVLDHLLFYARLKGVTSSQEAATARRCLTDVKLNGFENRLVSGLSGGEKRRLSIAIALVGDPKVVFLDEPTTGLDPEVRRLIWDVIEHARLNRTIILTTHSMEEAETCCQQLSIMAQGTLTCIGPLLRLKQLYGSGYKVHVTARSPTALNRATKFIEQQVLGTLTTWNREPDKLASLAPLAPHHPRTGRWVFMPRPGIVQRVLAMLPSLEGVVDWGIEQRGLDDVFLNIVGEDLLE
ncbi:hypothetical protein PhCBS80983_g05191 [Powellomyces hirtus]|uniref:ABC transporter domain-containing protein n=1 Tax=Powellomyces hirtus TaxID=109895 RepID=A0A507DV17_9FUNG|nr:hypothetical protein PhCBS80983_g05191 [Powellomyces hirtus]